MTSSTSKGNYYKRKSREYYESLGYETQLCEFVCGRMIGQGKFIYQKRDVFSSDGISMNGKEIIFWNSKSTTEEREGGYGVKRMEAEARKEFEKHQFPPCVKRQAIIWLPRKKPLIINL